MDLPITSFRGLRTETFREVQICAFKMAPLEQYLRGRKRPFPFPLTSPRVDCPGGFTAAHLVPPLPWLQRAPLSHCPWRPPRSLALFLSFLEAFSASPWAGQTHCTSGYFFSSGHAWDSRSHSAERGALVPRARGLVQVAVGSFTHTMLVGSEPCPQPPAARYWGGRQR